MKTPIIFFSDHIACPSGLARITRDLAVQTHHYLGDQFKVATLGYGSPGSARFPFPTYHWNERWDFVPTELPYIWNDFCGAEGKGILFTIGDVQRFLPLADPNFTEERKFAQWWRSKRDTKEAKLWGYFPVDAYGVDGKLGPQLGHTLAHYDRRLVPSKWAQEIIHRTIPNHSCDAIPHGIDTDIFFPRLDAEKEALRALELNKQWPAVKVKSLPKDVLKIGIVATNQARKDWGLGIETVAELKRRGKPVWLWCHTDTQKRAWSILELLSDFNLLQQSVITTGYIDDHSMANIYSALDLTLGIGRGEGFGYPIFESIFCGTPCFAGDYGAQAEFMDETHLLKPIHEHLDGPLNLFRPVYKADDWADAILQYSTRQITLPDELKWSEVWPKFAEWLKGGLD